MVRFGCFDTVHAVDGMRGVIDADLPIARMVEAIFDKLEC